MTDSTRGAKGGADPIRALLDAGQSVWLDFMHRGILKSGELRRLVETGIRGVTSNPTIFEKAITGSHDYDEQISKLAAEGKSTTEIYEAVVVDDIRGAADTLRPVFDATGGADGFVSIEVSPLLAHDTPGTIQEVRRWNSLITRPNVMVKIPGTPEGYPAIEEMIAEGRHINITLLFSIEAYRRVQEAYLRGLERRVAAGEPVHQVASVASFFVSRIDTEADKRLEARAAAAPPEQAETLRALRGKVAVANAKLAYRLYQQTFTGARWQALAGRGARVQRPLWASTSTKNPAYPDLLYVETLVGRDTINTLPPQTIEALRDHGRVVPDAVTRGVDEADRVFAKLREVGLSIDAVTQAVLDAGVQSFADSFNQLTKAIASRSQDVKAGGRR
ncbi:MAG TPA: transaldolase [bacterium]|nr:transaldolase [bacterium]